ncbi:2-hydroxymuconate tautomerase family protein [Sulfurimonas sp.]
MPYVNIKITEETTTKKQKQKLVLGVTKLLKKVLDKNPKTTFVIIEEISCDNWGVNNRLVSDNRICK